MKTKFHIDDALLIETLEREYEIDVEDFYFLPKGDSAYGYIIKSSHGNKFFMKLYDSSTSSGKDRIKDLDTYLPLIYEMKKRELFKYLTFPYKNRWGNFSTDLGFAVVILFNYIEGRTLENDYPFTVEIEKKIAHTLARLHGATPFLDIKASRTEGFETTYLDSLKVYLSYLNDPGEKSNQYIDMLRDYILPRREIIYEFAQRLQQYQRQSKKLLVDGMTDMVVSHGDVWGGNIIIDNGGNLNLIDWESTMIAPAERDIKNYIGEHFDSFLEEYERALGRKVNLYTHILGYYVYNSHLSNLTNWIKRILFENKSEEQNLSDMDCIMNHCMNRWADAEETLKNLSPILEN